MEKPTLNCNVQYTHIKRIADLQKCYKPFNNIIKDKGQLGQFRTTELKFTNEDPIQIDIQKSYDDSVNLIINDGNSIPKLINSRFSVTKDGKYEIIDRSGSFDTNLYNESTLLSEISLFKNYTNFPKIELDKVYNDGNLKVGLYAVYIKYSDADGNETNIAGESGLIPCAAGIGEKVNGAYADFNSKKAFKLKISNIDISYNYLSVYYSRYSSDQFQLTNTSIFKILDKIPVLGRHELEITISGNENIEPVTPTQLNTDFDNIQSCKTQAINQNRLFLGNIQKTYIDYDNLADLSLHIYPTLYQKFDKQASYYVPQNVYSGVGYWNEELYRFGIVYIYQNNTLSPVFNILGVNSLSYEYNDELNPDPDDLTNEMLGHYQIKDKRQYVKINNIDYSIKGEYNSKGVSRINSNSNKRIGIKFVFNQSDEIKKILLEQGIVGYFFVRQKRIPTILAEAMVLPHATHMFTPTNKKGETQVIIDNTSKYLNEDASPKIYKPNISRKSFCLICPEFEVRQPYYNQLFNNSEFVLKDQNNNSIKAKLCSVKEDVPSIVVDGVRFSSRAGTAEDATKFNYDYSTITKMKNAWGKKKCVAVQRGIFGPYVGAVCNSIIVPKAGENVKIFIPNYSLSNMEEYRKIRYNDNSQYYSISDRISINDDELESPVCYRGDCYYCKFTHRLIRNFQDPSAPNNDEIVKQEGYAQYKYEDGAWKGKEKINIGDINAIKLGEWVECYVNSTCNLSIRSVDDTHSSEIALTGYTRSFYPYRDQDTSGNNKIPESQFINEGFSQSLSQRYYFLKSDIPVERNNFTNQVMYSDIGVNDAYQNGLRVFKKGNSRNYNTEYGALTKLLSQGSHLIAVFEHGICQIPINSENGVKQASADTSINMYNILPESPIVLSDTYGSKWIESIIKTSKGIYGIDIDAKRIWRITDSGFSVISDHYINSFLDKNAVIDKNYYKYDTSDYNFVTSNYNAHKQDVMFTLYSSKGKKWNICYNEILNKWITFYSWTPLLSTNVNNVMYSFPILSNILYKHNVDADPCYWYNEQHPFEFEFSVIDSPLSHKIFDNLIIVSNNAEPESFHYTIVGDCYNFANQKEFMYFRQEATHSFLKENASKYFIETDDEFLEKYSTKSVPKRSALFPNIYYTENPFNNKMYSTWLEMTDNQNIRSYAHLSGTTLSRNGQEINITEHSPARNITNPKYGRLRGNIHYKEDRWFVQISPISITYKNETKFVRSYYPQIVFNNIPKYLLNTQLKNVPKILSDKGYDNTSLSIDISDWGTLYNNQAKTREEIKLKDKYIKIKIRYKGDKKAFIHSVLTKYTEVL